MWTDFITAWAEQITPPKLPQVHLVWIDLPEDIPGPIMQFWQALRNQSGYSCLPLPGPGDHHGTSFLTDRRHVEVPGLPQVEEAVQLRPHQALLLPLWSTPPSSCLSLEIGRAHV